MAKPGKGPDWPAELPFAVWMAGRDAAVTAGWRGRDEKPCRWPKGPGRARMQP